MYVDGVQEVVMHIRKWTQHSKVPRRRENSIECIEQRVRVCREAEG
jgi:hypothetical protein